MRLSALVAGFTATDPEITGVTADSRKVRPGFLFAALPGSTVDGRAFIPGAIDAGAAAVLAPDDVSGLAVPVVHATDLRRAYALADLYERSGDVPQARALFAQLLHFDPEFLDVSDRVAALD
jgi:UDP-N-acetylmuramyl tripeptide synthase